MRLKQGIAGIALGILLGIVFLGVFFVGAYALVRYQQAYVCKPKIEGAIRDFLSIVSKAEYGQVAGLKVFLNEEEFQTFKAEMSDQYSIEFVEWFGPLSPAVTLRFDDGTVYGVVLVLKNGVFSQCWGTKYHVFTVAS